MSNFYESFQGLEQQFGELADRIVRVEAHLRHGERRAALARIGAIRAELIAMAQQLEMPVETMLVGAQIGLMTEGPLVRGRLAGVIFGATAGWFFGQSVLTRQRARLGDYLLQLEILEEAVHAQHEAAKIAKQAATT